MHYRPKLKAKWLTKQESLPSHPSQSQNSEKCVELVKMFGLDPHLGFSFLKLQSSSLCPVTPSLYIYLVLVHDSLWKLLFWFEVPYLSPSDPTTFSSPLLGSPEFLCQPWDSKDEGGTLLWGKLIWDSLALPGASSGLSQGSWNP